MTSYSIAVIGGTGPQGKGLAYRFARAGHTVAIGSRSSERARQTATDIALRVGDDARAKTVAVDLARAVTGRAGIDAGALRPARQPEPLTAVLIGVNKRYRVRSGIRIAGLGHDG